LLVHDGLVNNQFNNLFISVILKKAIIIGSGIGGIATSIRLSVKGYDVAIYEGNDVPGGKLSQFYMDGYRFDFGPSLFTLPLLVDELFNLAGIDPREHFNYTKLDESCKYFYEDGIQLNAYSDKEKLSHELSEKTGVTPSVIKKYFDHCKLIYDYTKPIFLEKSLHKFKNFVSYDTVRALSKAHEFDLLESMHDANKRRIQEPHLVQLFDRYATYNGSNPYKAPGILNLIPTLEHVEGSFFPTGGMYQITSSLVNLAKKLGVNFYFGRKVDEIILKKSRATGIRIGTDHIEADVIVSNMDVFLTYKNLLKEITTPNSVIRQERSSSAMVFYWGINKKFSNLGLHNIFFSKDYKNEFDQLFKNQSISDDPTVYINITSKLNPSDAPTGHENWFVMVNAPSTAAQDWTELVNRTRKNVIEKLDRIMGINLEELIACEEVTDPKLIESKTLSYKGSIYGTSSNSRAAAFLRHPNFKRKIKNLFFCGGSVHPGGGIPLCLMSAKIVDTLI